MSFYDASAALTGTGVSAQARGMSLWARRAGLVTTSAGCSPPCSDGAHHRALHRRAGRRSRRASRVHVPGLVGAGGRLLHHRLVLHLHARGRHVGRHGAARGHGGLCAGEGGDAGSEAAGESETEGRSNASWSWSDFRSVEGSRCWQGMCRPCCGSALPECSMSVCRQSVAFCLSMEYLPVSVPLDVHGRPAQDHSTPGGPGVGRHGRGRAAHVLPPRRGLVARRRRADHLARHRPHHPLPVEAGSRRTAGAALAGALVAPVRHLRVACTSSFPSPPVPMPGCAKPNAAPLFGGRSALDRMLGGQVADLFVVRQYLDAQRGGKA